MNLETLLESALLPTLPQVAVRLLEISKNPEAEIQEVVKAIKLDPAIAIKILKAANSSYFTFRSEVTTIERAVPMLGTNVVSSLVLSFSLVDSITSTGPLARYYQDYWKQSIAQAAAAETIGTLCGEGIACENFLAGLMMDIGRLAMLRTLGEKYLPVLQQTDLETTELFLVELEREAFGFDHTDVGAGLLAKWNLDPCLIDAARSHHLATNELQSMGQKSYFQLLKTTALASAVCDYFCGQQLLLNSQRLNSYAQDLFGFDEGKIQLLLDEVRQKINGVAEMFAVDMSSISSPQDLLAMANEQLAQLAMRQQQAMSQAAQEQQSQLAQATQELKQENNLLREQAFFDPLTQVYNRRFFDETLQKEISRSRREQKMVGLVLVDIDHFKKLNDNFGHQFGDEVLQLVAKTLNTTTRDADTLARYGGEEFVVIAHQPSVEGLTVLAERMRRSIESLKIEHAGTRVPVTISVGAGIADCNCVDVEKLKNELIGLADRMLYLSKDRGRNRLHVDVLKPPRHSAIPAYVAKPTPNIPAQS